MPPVAALIDGGDGLRDVDLADRPTESASNLTLPLTIRKLAFFTWMLIFSPSGSIKPVMTSGEKPIVNGLLLTSGPSLDRDRGEQLRGRQRASIRLFQVIVTRLGDERLRLRHRVAGDLVGDRGSRARVTLSSSSCRPAASAESTAWVVAVDIDLHALLRRRDCELPALVDEDLRVLRGRVDLIRDAGNRLFDRRLDRSSTLLSAGSTETMLWRSDVETVQLLTERRQHQRRSRRTASAGVNADLQSSPPSPRR